MKKNAIMLADTRAALVGTVLLQLHQTNPNLFDEAIIYYLEPISESDRKIMSSIIPCRFIHYEPIIPEDLFEKPRFKRFSALMFCRYEMFKYLDEFETITWLDTDILIQKDLTEMIEIANKTGAAFIREDPINKTAENVDFMRTCFSRDVSGFQMDAYLYCSGTIVFSRKILLEQKIDGRKCTNWCYQKTVQWANILELPDQGVLNAAIQHFSIKVGLLKGKEYCCYPALGRDCSNATIIHAWGSNKFWNDWYIYTNFPLWKEYYKNWLNIGGSSLMFDIQPAISIIIPSYRPNLSFFKQCLDSLMSQCRDNWERYSDFEIIIIAEPFEQREIEKLIESYHDNRFRLEFNSEKLGIAASLNRGLRLAKGRYIARIDDDDICDKTRLFLQTQYLNSHSDIMLCTSDFEYFGDMNEWRMTFENNMSHAWSIFTCPFDHPTVMFRKDFFLKNELLYDEKRGYVEDWELWRRAFKKGMTVGCIHKVLFYHRWINNESAGQNSKTVDMMRELIQKNFLELGVNIPQEYLKIIGPWNGKLTNNSDINKLEEIFRDALDKNKYLHIYDQKCLEKAFELRLIEAKTGILPELSRKKQENIPISQERILCSKSDDKAQKTKKIIKNLLRPLYKPFRHRYEDRLINIQKSVWINEGHIMDCINKMDEIISNQQIQIKILNQKIDEILEDSANVNYRVMMQEQKYKEDINDLSQKLLKESEMKYSQFSSEISEQLENTKTKLIDSMREENETTRQELSTKMYIESENTRQELSAKIYDEAENTRQELSVKVYTNVGITCQELHRHIDFTYRDIMIAMERQKSYLPYKLINLITDYPVAYKSLDHLYPHGTIRDNTRYPRFIKKCEELLGRENGLAFLDLGCSGGGMVLDAALRGHLSIGLEGSDCSAKELRAEWRLLGDRLKTCDITKPFRLEQADGMIQKFDIITAWEVMEHIAENDLPQLFCNIQEHLSDDGYFIASIANWDDIDPKTGVNWHVTVHPYDWWKARFEQAGFVLCFDLLQPIDLARGGYNPPHCYEEPYPEINETKTFHIVAQKKY